MGSGHEDSDAQRRRKESNRLIAVGVGMRKQHERGGPPEALDVSIESLREAAALSMKLDVDQRMSALGSLGLSLRRRFRASGNRRDLDEAVLVHEEALRITPSDSPYLAGMYSNLAGTLRMRWQEDGSRTDLDAAVHNYRTARSVIPPQHPFLPELLSNLGNALRTRFQADGSQEDLDESVDLLRDAIDRATGSPQLADFLANLSDSLQERWLQTGIDEDLDLALDSAQQAVDISAGTTSADHLTALVTALSMEHVRTGRIDILDEALSLGEKALRLTRPASPESQKCMINLAAAAQLRYLAGGEPGDLDTAIALHRRILAEAPPASPDLPNLLGDAATCLHIHHDRTGDEDALAEAIRLLEQAEQTPQAAGNPLLRAELSARIGPLLTERASAHRDTAGLEAAAARLRAVLEVLPDNFANRVSVVSSLEIAERKRYELTGDSEALRRANSALSALADVPNLPPATALSVAHNTALQATRDGRWTEAGQAYQRALDAATESVALQAMRRHREHALRDVQGLAGEAAYAFVRAGDPWAAVMALEGGRAVLLADVLRRDRAEVDRLREEGHAETVERFLRAAQNLERYEQAELITSSPGTEGIPRLARRAREEFDTVVAEIRSLPTHTSFLDNLGLEDVAAVAADMPLVYVVPHVDDGVLLYVHGDSVEAERVPGLAHQELAERMRPYLQAYDEGRVEFADAMDGLTAWLWNAFMGELTKRLRPHGRARLVPVGVIGLLPLHAAWTSDASRPGGRRYVIDDLIVSYAPSAAAFAASLRRLPSQTADSLLVVSDPQPVSLPGLSWSLPEGAAAAAAFSRTEVLSGSRATAPALLAAIASYDVVHLACHARGDLSGPLSSTLLMAGDETVTLAELMVCDLSRVRLVLLAACETALMGIALPDEVLHFPTGLLQAGVASTVGTLWRVGDRSTALLMSRFYDRWRDGRADPAEALRDAQQWLRGATNAELEDVLPNRPDIANAAGAAARLWARARPHHRPVDWAGFVHVGA